jgi:hypothetical protein
MFVAEIHRAQYGGTLPILLQLMFWTYKNPRERYNPLKSETDQEVSP